MDWFLALDYWHWWVLGVVLIFLEVLSPGVFFLWMGIAAGIVGGILLFLPDLRWEFQILAFGFFSVVTVFLWKAYLKRHPTPSDQPLLNRRGEQYVGRIFTLQEPVVNGDGKIVVDDSTWKISGVDCPAGTRVRVTGADGVVLLVKPE